MFRGALQMCARRHCAGTDAPRAEPARAAYPQHAYHSPMFPSMRKVLPPSPIVSTSARKTQAHTQGAYFGTRIVHSTPLKLPRKPFDTPGAHNPRIAPCRRAHPPRPPAPSDYDSVRARKSAHHLRHISRLSSHPRAPLEERPTMAAHAHDTHPAPQQRDNRRQALAHDGAASTRATTQPA